MSLRYLQTPTWNYLALNTGLYGESPSTNCPQPLCWQNFNSYLTEHTQRPHYKD